MCLFYLTIYIYIYIYIYILSYISYIYIYIYIYIFYLTIYIYIYIYYLTIYIYIYIYIVLHRQTVSLYHNFSVWLDTLDASSWNRNPPNCMYVRLITYRSAIGDLTSVREFNTFCMTFVCLHFMLSECSIR